MGPVCDVLSCGTRLHLQHGPIDLIVGADGDRKAAFGAARQRFSTILQELVDELPLLRAAAHCGTSGPTGKVARRMHHAVLPHSEGFVTCMAAVAGAVADEVLAAMLAEANLRRAYVNNGGDIALHLMQGETFRLAMATPQGQDLGRIEIEGGQGIGGIATSGLGGRSLTLGIADSVTVLARHAAAADVAATLVANAVDLPGHPAIRRRPAQEVRDDSDLGQRLVTLTCGALTETEIEQALACGAETASQMATAGQIDGAALFLRGHCRTLGTPGCFHHRSEQDLHIA